MLMMNFYNFTPEKIEVICILPVGRSSSFFFQGLLEGHSSIVTMPYYSFQKLKSKKNFNSFFKKIYDENLKHDFKMYNFDVEEYINFKKFKKYLQMYLDTFGFNTKSFFIGMHYAYARIMKQDIKKIKYLVFQSHEANQTTTVLDCFPRSKIIFTTRDPRANCLSYQKKEQYLFSFTQIFPYKLFKKIRNNTPTLIVRHEDIHLNYSVVRKNIIKFLNLKESSSLNSSSMVGKPFYGSNVHGSYLNLKANLPNPAFVNSDWKKELSRQDIKFIQWFYKNLMNDFGYKKINLKQISERTTKIQGFGKNLIKDFGYKKINQEQIDSFVIVYRTKFYLTTADGSLGLKGKYSKSLFNIVYSIPLLGRFLIKCFFLFYYIVFVYMKPNLQISFYSKKSKNL